jgi:phosphate starvation-inducible PhoH-like protein/PhoH-like ATPase
MRGRNIKNSFLCIDEAQCGTIDDLQLILTRVHDTSKAVVIGHSGQLDTKVQAYGGLIPFEVYQKHMSKKSFVDICELKVNYRGKVSQWSDEIQQTIKELTNGN